MELFRQGVGMVKIGKLVGCGTAPVQRIKSEMKTLLKDILNPAVYASFP